MQNLLSVHAAAQLLKTSDQHVSSLLRGKTLRGDRVGKQWIISKNALEEYITNNSIIIEPDDHPRTSENIPDIVALSFFTGAMGLDLGMERAGISPLLTCEIDKEARKTIHANRPKLALVGDIRNYDAATIREYAKIPKTRSIDVVFGGPPCQAFSTAGKQRGFEDERGNVFLSFINLALNLSPKYLVIENVRGLLSAKYPLGIGKLPEKGGVLYAIIGKLSEAGYAVSFELYNAANFGAPQIRERVVMICKKGRGAVNHLSPTHSKSGEFDLPLWTTLGDALRGLEVEHHHVEFPEKRLKYFKMLREGQNWRDLPDDIQRDAMGKSYTLPGGKTGFYRRLSFAHPSPTLVTHPAMPATALCHPVQDRPLSVEEYKRIQGFPDDWVVCGSTIDAYKQIGNAVPISLAKAIGKTIVADIRGDELPLYKDFRYSRYLKTSHTQFIEAMSEKLKAS